MTLATEPSSHTFEEASAVSAETFLEGDASESGDGIPTIELSSSSKEFHVQTIEISNIQHQDDLPESAIAITVAELVADSVKDSNLEEGTCRVPTSHMANRAEFVSATFIKETAGTPLGFNLHKSDNEISSITAGSLASSSPLQVGDRIYSINKRKFSSMGSLAICKYLQSLVGRMTVVVHNKGGSASFVESMVTKAHPRERSGLVLKRVGNSGSLLVSNIRDDKVFIDSLLNIGDEVLFINGISCQNLSPTEAANIIKETPKDVTVVARSLLETGVVVAELSSRDLMSPLSPSHVRLQQALNRRRQESNPEGKRMSRERASCAVFSLIGLVVVVSFIVAARFRDKDHGVYYSQDDMEQDVLQSQDNYTNSLGCSYWGFDCNDFP